MSIIELDSRPNLASHSRVLSTLQLLDLSLDPKIMRIREKRRKAFAARGWPDSEDHNYDTLIARYDRCCAAADDAAYKVWQKRQFDWAGLVILAEQAARDCSWMLNEGVTLQTTDQWVEKMDVVPGQETLRLISAILYVAGLMKEGDA